METCSPYSTWHQCIPVSEPHRGFVAPLKTINISLVGQTQPEILLWSHPHQADKERIIHPEEERTGCEHMKAIHYYLILSIHFPQTPWMKPTQVVTNHDNKDFWA